MDRKALVTAACILAHPWHGYCPTPVGEAFHSSAADNRYIIAGSQTGKTLACAREAWMYAGDCHPFRFVPKRAGLGLIAVGSLEGTAYDGVMRALWRTRPDHLIDWSRTTWNGKGFVGNFIAMKNGNVVRIVSSRGGSTGAAGVGADWVWIDEPPKQARFSELLARVTQTDGHVWLSFTPFDSEQADLDWLRNYLEGDPERGTPAESPGWDKFNMELSVAACPWMSQQQVDKIVAQTPLWVADQRLRGMWETPPVDGFFHLDMAEHGLYENRFDMDPTRAGAWHYRLAVDHGELATHQGVVFLGIRKFRAEHGYGVEVATLGEYVNQGRTSFIEDAAGMRMVMERIARVTKTPRLAEPAAWAMVGDVNSAGKGMAGVSANEALAQALGVRKNSIEKPDKSAGSIVAGLTALRTALDTRPSRLRIAHGGDAGLSCPLLLRAMRQHSGKDDNSKHLIDALRYGAAPFLSLEPAMLARLEAPGHEQVTATRSRAA